MWSSDHINISALHPLVSPLSKTTWSVPLSPSLLWITYWRSERWDAPRLKQTMSHQTELMFSFIETLIAAGCLSGEIWVGTKTILHISPELAVDLGNASLAVSPSNNSPNYTDRSHPASPAGAASQWRYWSVFPSNTSTSAPPHPPPLTSCSYAMTLNLDPLSIFCPEHKGLLFFLLSGLHGSPWLTPIKSAVSSNKYVVQGDKQACPAPPQPPHSGLTLHSGLHNTHTALPKPSEAAENTDWTRIWRTSYCNRNSSINSAEPTQQRCTPSYFTHCSTSAELVLYLHHYLFRFQELLLLLLAKRFLIWIGPI